MRPSEDNILEVSYLTKREKHSKKNDILQLTSIFVLLIIFLILAAYYLLQGAHLHSTILIGSMIPLFILMVLKGKSMKEK